VSIVNASSFGVSGAVVKEAEYVRLSERPLSERTAAMFGLPMIVILWFFEG
jgi:hypothetical protein